MIGDMNDREDQSGATAAELTCEESLALVYEYLDGELAPERTEQVRRHLEKCRACYPHFNFERLFLDYVHDTGCEGCASEELERRVRRLLAAE